MTRKNPESHWQMLMTSHGLPANWWSDQTRIKSVRSLVLIHSGVLYASNPDCFFEPGCCFVGFLINDHPTQLHDLFWFNALHAMQWMVNMKESVVDAFLCDLVYDLICQFWICAGICSLVDRRWPVSPNVGFSTIFAWNSVTTSAAL